MSGLISMMSMPVLNKIRKEAHYTCEQFVGYICFSYRVFQLYLTTPGQCIGDCLKYPKMSKSKAIRFSFLNFLSGGKSSTKEGGGADWQVPGLRVGCGQAGGSGPPACSSPRAWAQAGGRTSAQLSPTAASAPASYLQGPLFPEP